MKINSILLISILFLLFKLANSQENSQAGLFKYLPDGLKINGYVDMYYASDNDEGDYLRQFSAIAPYRDDFKLNYVSLALRYTSENFRGNAVIHFGDVPNVNWPADNRYIQEANIGFMPAKNFWIDAGYFLTHIGGEGVIPKYNYFTSLALCTYFEPFYQSGIRLSFDFSDKISAQLHVINSYNVFSDNHKHKSGGVQVDYKPFDRLEVIYNNLIGKETPRPDNVSRLRFYNNLVLKLTPSKKIAVIVCSDFCTQEKSGIVYPTASSIMYSGFASIKYSFVKKFSVSGRGEYYSDKDGILSGTYFVNSDTVGLKAYGISLGLEYNPVEFGYIRLETRYLKAVDAVLSNGKDNRLEGILSLGAEF